MRIHIKRKPKLAKQWSIYAYNQLGNPDTIEAGIVIAIPFFYVFIYR